MSLSLPPTLAQQAVQVALLNTLGQTVWQRSLPASAAPIRALPLEGVAAGIYTVRLQTGVGTFSQRLSVE